MPDGAHFCCFENCIEICFQPDHAAYHIIPNALAIAFAVECTAIAGSVGYALCLTDISTDCTADVESLLASLDCTDHVRVWRWGSMRWCCDDEHAHTGTVALAVFRADSAAKLAAVVAAANRGPIDSNSELSGLNSTPHDIRADTVADDSATDSGPVGGAIAGSVGYAFWLTDISTDCTADVESLLASQATTLYDGAFMGALIGTSFPPDRMAKCHKPTVDLADQASDADSHRHAHSHAVRSSHTHPHLCAE